MNHCWMSAQGRVIFRLGFGLQIRATRSTAFLKAIGLEVGLEYNANLSNVASMDRGAFQSRWRSSRLEPDPSISATVSPSEPHPQTRKTFGPDGLLDFTTRVRPWRKLISWRSDATKRTHSQKRLEVSRAFSQDFTVSDSKKHRFYAREFDWRYDPRLKPFAQSPPDSRRFP